MKQNFEPEALPESFDCEKLCQRREQLYQHTGKVYNQRVETGDFVPKDANRARGGAFMLLDIYKAFSDVLDESDGTDDVVTPRFQQGTLHGMVICQESPNCQEECPLPVLGSERCDEVVDAVVNIVIEKQGLIQNPVMPEVNT